MLDFNSLISINSGVFGSANTLSTPQSASYVIYFSMLNSELFSNNGTLRQSTYIYDSTLGIRLCQSDVSNGVIIIKSRSWQNGPGIGYWSASAVNSFLMSANLINPTTCFIYFSEGRSILTSDLSASNSQIFSSLITFNIFPSSLSQINLILKYKDFNSSISKEILYFDKIDDKTPLIITSSPQTLSATIYIPAGLQSITFVVYSITPIFVPQILFIQPDTSKFVLDSRSVFYLNTSNIINTVVSATTIGDIGIASISSSASGPTNKPLVNSTFPPTILPDIHLAICMIYFKII